MLWRIICSLFLAGVTALAWFYSEKELAKDLVTGTHKLSGFSEHLPGFFRFGLLVAAICWAISPRFSGLASSIFCVSLGALTGAVIMTYEEVVLELSLFKVMEGKSVIDITEFTQAGIVFGSSLAVLLLFYLTSTLVKRVQTRS